MIFQNLRFTVYLFLLVQFPSQASHLMGGEITWRCQGTQYIFTLKLYRDCNGITQGANITMESNSPAGNIPMSRIEMNDLTPVGTGCPTCASPIGYQNAVQEHIFESAPITLNGIPPVGGWYFAYSDCCRNVNITNLGAAGSGSFTLRAIMYPYHGRNTNPCFDNSPQFSEPPQLAICAGDTMFYNANVTDAEQDSVVFEWAHPLDGSHYAATFNYLFAANYYFNNPLPDDTINPNNINATLDPKTGMLNFKSVTSGVYVIVIKTTAYKCGIKVSEIFREHPIALMSGCYLTPVVPYNGALNTAPRLLDVQGNSYFNFKSTITPGDSVDLPFYITEYEPVNQTPPLTFQQFSLTASGDEFGRNYTSSNTGCPYPPCAQILSFNSLPTNLLDTVQPITPLFFPLQAQFRFVWKTECGQIVSNPDCNDLSSEYRFVLRLTDNFCPSPSVSYSTLTFLLQDIDPGAVRMKCISRNTNGHIQLTFLPPSDVGVLDSVTRINGFNVYRSLNGLNGPYSFVDSVYGFTITNPDTVLTFTDTLTASFSGNASYFLATKAGCTNRDLSYSDTISYIHLSGTANAYGANISWNPHLQPYSSTSTGVYQIYREQPAGSGNWVNVVGIAGGNIYQDNLPNGQDTVRYYVSMEDSAGGPCISYSDTIQIAVSPSVMIEEIRHLNDIEIFPNPGNGWFTLRSNSGIHPNMTVRILDISGHQLRTFNQLASSPTGTVKINLQDFKSGLYFLQLEENGYQSLRKILMIELP